MSSSGNTNKMLNKNEKMVPLPSIIPISLIASISDTNASMKPANDNIKADIKMDGRDFCKAMI